MRNKLGKISKNDCKGENNQAKLEILMEEVR
jgi:hypothetical protein